ncbi:MAG: Holliday junction branch migration protein RuvA [Lachnospiraceae bacterium]|nr:Holliday junction branch migration protein RuvA [Lachnospiraceae bacterium]
MIAFLRGEVISVSENRVVLEVNHVGYQILISSRDAADMPSVGETVKLHTYFSVREDAMQLFGFLSEDDLETYKLLLNVNGIGPKAGLGILSALSSDELRFAVLAEDAKTISKAPGIGNKTAQKLILELKDKMSLEDAFEKRLQKASPETSREEDARSEAVQALVALGYSNSDALRAVKGLDITEDMDAEAILKQALKKISFL